MTHIFLTGKRDAGKTTIINRVVERLPGSFNVGGFRTFKGNEFAPEKNYVLMAPVAEEPDLSVNSPHFKVALRDKSKSSFEAYPDAFDEYGVRILTDSSDADIIILDELGFMESDALKFQNKVMELLDGETPVLGVIKPDSRPFLDRVKNHPKVRVIEITSENRDDMPQIILDSLIQGNNDNVPILTVSQLSFFYEDANIPSVSDINISIMPGTINVILGPSGCGKTTLCRCLTGIIPNAYDGKLTGKIQFRGSNIIGDKLSKIAEKIGLVMQEPDNQIVASTVEDDIAFGPENMMTAPDMIRDIVDGKIDEMSLHELELRSPTRLSGGEKQRTIIAGILALGPEIMVFDEPMSSLDEESKVRFINVVKALKEDGKTVIIVEHDFYRLDFADNWIIMKDGNMMAEGKPSDIDKKLLEVELWH